MNTKSGLEEPQQSSSRPPLTLTRSAVNQANQFIAGGTTRGALNDQTNPVFIQRGDSCYVWDIEGNRYVDFINSSFALPLGHNHAETRDALVRQLQHGTFFTAHNETESLLAQAICNRVPSIEKLKFCNSGTEATMFAARAARAYTGRAKVAKMLGGFHGTNDTFSTGLGIMSAAKVDKGTYDPKKEAALGLTHGAVQDTVLLSFNDIGFCEQVIETHKHTLSAIFVEPIMGAAGMITPQDDFLQFLRDITKRYGILLVFDEMISMGIAKGGAQEFYGVTPDLTCCGKVIGAGMPIGCVGGIESVMQIFDSRKHQPAVNHGGTFAGHPLSMVAGAKQLSSMTPEVYSHLHALGDKIRGELRALFSDLQAPLQVTGAGQFFCYHLTSDNVINYETARTADNSKLPQIMDVLLEKGIFQARTSRGAVSYPMKDSHINQYVEAMSTALIKTGLAA